jgi:hypothetical protein
MRIYPLSTQLILPAVICRGISHFQYTVYPQHLSSKREYAESDWRVCSRTSVPYLSSRFPTMTPLWAITSPTRLRPGVPAWTLRRQTHAPKTREFPRRYSAVPPGTNSESDSRIFTDPERPDLFYHLFEAPSAVSATNHVFGLSFLEALKSKEDARSPRILGYLPASEGGHAVEAGLNDFRENRESTNQFRRTYIVNHLVW